ncbi:hypothetical protein [Carboxylicivirga sp. N1Y90]|uniref:hypothetical protein n=1 Tax=Carboxylicivirga fragile TaxID=3417571 RepID=UPI003D353E8A|nr:hypothetical protein [Marinilabiliaceae bacterium N1Y90]
MSIKSFVLTVLVVFVFIYKGVGQNVPHHISNEVLYDFIDELANKGVIEVNSVIKPYSRKQIATWLQAANGDAGLSKRQQKELDFYLKDFNKELIVGKDFDKRWDLFYHSDSLFKITVNPILGGQFFNNGEKTEYHRWGGAEFHGTIGKHVGIYGSLRDNHESHFLGGSQYISKRPGAVYKGDNSDKDYSETRGGITLSWNWGSLGLHKDHFSWGSGYNQSVIMSGRTPSFGFISFKMSPVSWFDFNYIHGWLVSEVIDSTRTYGVFNGEREVFANKFIAANMFTIKPCPKLNISFGNSIIYGDTDFNPTYMVPFLFYKSADHTYNSWDNWVGHNAQMYFDISSRQINKLHLYTSVFIDEVSLTNMFKSDKQSNDIAVKVGARVTDLLPDFSFTAEYTRIRPLVYQHFVPTVTFKSNQFSMGSYMLDNSEELYLAVRYKPIRGLDLQLSYSTLKKGKDYQEIFDKGEMDDHPEINQDQEEIRKGLPYMNEVRWKNTNITFTSKYQIIHDGYIFVEYQKNSISGPDMEKYTNPFFLAGDNIVSFGLNFGF